VATHRALYARVARVLERPRDPDRLDPDLRIKDAIVEWQWEIQMSSFLGLVMAAALIAPAQASSAPAQPVNGHVILIAEDCGRDAHRDERGICRPNWREMEGRECPRGWHVGPEGRRCWPN
jgi:hypothetical protein